VIDHDPVAAKELVAEGATIGRESGNRFAYGLCLSTLASLTGRLGDVEEAGRLYRSAIDNWRAAGNWTNQRIVLRNLAEFAPRVGLHHLTARLLGALDASGEMLGADVGPEGERLVAAITSARLGLGEERYNELFREGAATHPVVLVRLTLEALDDLDARASRNGPDVLHPVDGERPGSARDAATLLSARERQIVELVTSGLTNRAIGERLFISERTVDTHITRIRRKLGTTTRTQLAVWGLAHPGAVPGGASG
jgi:DNA-binding CsgD family transcriptional regulator